MTAPAYPDWARELLTHLVADTVDGRPVIRYVHVEGIFWDSACRICQGRTKILEIMPDHAAKGRCPSGGRSHCSCDTCF